MPLICFASQKGSPGASAAALAVAAAFKPGDGRRKLLLEADLSGGALAIRYRLPTEPGLVTLAAAARAGLTDDELWRHAHELPGGLPAIVGPDGPEQVHSALAAAGPLLGRHLAERRDVDVIADLGRLQPGSPAVELAAEATAVLMVSRPVAEQLQPAAQRMLALRPRIKNLGWLLVGEKPHGPAEVESTFGFPVVGVLADDRRSVEAIEGGEVTRRVRRHPFVRSAATVAGTLGTWLSPLTSAPPPTSDQSPSDTAAAASAHGPAHDAESLASERPGPEPPAASMASAVADPPAALPTPPEPAPPLESAPPARSNGHHRPAVAPTSLPGPDTASSPDSGPASIADSPGQTGPGTAPDAPPDPLTGNGVGTAPPDPAPPEPATASPSVVEIDPSTVPAPPLPPPREAEHPPAEPDPFVHGDDDVEWTGT